MIDDRTSNSFDTLLTQVALFADLDTTERATVSRLLHPFSAAAGEALFNQGAPPTGLYLVERGRVAVSARLFGESAVTLVELGPGAVLGEIALVDRQPRSAGARATEDTSGAFLALHVFDGLRAWLHPSALKLVLSITRGLTDRLRELYDSMGGPRKEPEPAAAERAEAGVEPRWLEILPTLSTLSPDEMRRLRGRARCHEFRRGAVVARAGTAADEVFIVVRGALELRASGRRVALLGPSGMTSEASFLDPRPRSVDVVAREDALVLAVPSDAIEEWLVEYSHFSFKLVDAVVRAAGQAVRTASRRRAQLSGEMHALIIQTSSS